MEEGGHAASEGMPSTAPPSPPYYAVIFTSSRTEVDEGYAEMSKRMVELAQKQPGYLGMDSARSGGTGITVSYWTSEEAIRQWKSNSDHLEAQRMGREKWYSNYSVRVCKVERAYSTNHA